jgi:hypothetical protein
MPEITENSLMMSIQAVHQTISQTSIARDAANGSEQADYDEIIEAYEITAMELRRVYETVLAQGVDLPPYQSLVS